MMVGGLSHARPTRGRHRHGHTRTEACPHPLYGLRARKRAHHVLWLMVFAYRSSVFGATVSSPGRRMFRRVAPPSHVAASPTVAVR